MSRPYAILDVFTDTPLSGNPLAVVLDAEGLDGDRMQAIAREFNLSETVFVLPPESPRHRARLRIFTPGRELPFAGHPTVGTAVLLALDEDGTASATVASAHASASRKRIGHRALRRENAARTCALPVQAAALRNISVTGLAELIADSAWGSIRPISASTATRPAGHFRRRALRPDPAGVPRWRWRRPGRHGRFRRSGFAGRGQGGRPIL